MRRKIPSSAALLAFEAAARHGNFARAAAELALTEGAISRQIARLEALPTANYSTESGAGYGSIRPAPAMPDRSARSSAGWSGKP